MFHALTQKDIERILEIQMKHFAFRLEEMGVQIELTPEAKALLAKKGYDPEFGARPLKRTVVKEVETPVSRMLIAGDLPAGSVLKIDVSGEDLHFSRVS